QDLEQPCGAARLACEDLGERLHGVDRSPLVDEQAGGPVAAHQRAGDVGDHADIEAADVRLAEMPLLDPDAEPSLAIAFSRRVLAERDHARTENRAVAREDEIALQPPGFGHKSLHSADTTLEPAPRFRSS